MCRQHKKKAEVCGKRGRSTGTVNNPNQEVTEKHEGKPIGAKVAIDRDGSAVEWATHCAAK